MPQSKHFCFENFHHKKKEISKQYDTCHGWLEIPDPITNQYSSKQLKQCDDIRLELIRKVDFKNH